MVHCVLRAFLCGEDALTGRSYEHRKAWIVGRLRELASVLAIDVCAYAVLGNHCHAVLRAEPNRGWDRDEVLHRWRLLFSGGVLVERYVPGDATQAEREDKRGHIPGHLAPILERLGYSPGQWLAAARGFRRRFGPFAGASQCLRFYARSQRS